MRYIRGWDSYDEDVDTIYAEKREYIFGDILHSRPVIIDYTSTLRVVYVGTNDGMLHAINDTDGTERWAFIPPDLLPELKNMVESTVAGHQYYVDGSVKVYIKDVNRNGYIEDAQGDQVIIVFGERGGGTSYTALDVTNPDDPQYLWRVDNANPDPLYGDLPDPTTVLSQLGQSWSEPEIGKVKAGANEGIVAIIGGGYSSDNTKGKGLMLINLLTGALGQAGTLVKQFTYEDDRGAYPVLDNMTACIPSTVLAVDTNYDDYINRVYVGDLNGQMWRFGNQAGQEDGNVNTWTPRRLFQGNSGTKIFYAPDLVLEPGYAYVYFGTGDRNDPMDIPSPDPYINRFYAVKDKNETDAVFQSRVGGVLTESNLVDLTGDVLQDPDTTQATIAQIQSDLANGDGWFIIMDHDGEKVLAPPVVIFGIAIFTTFTPSSTVCSYGGDGRIYAVDYLNATAVADFDTTNEGLQKSDQSKVLGPGIPTEAVVIIGEDGKAHVVVAVGGKIVLIEELEGLFPPSGFTVQSWREQF
jgi:type IV pilus assembly protein PilY1